jgi:hypothetical protein
MHLLLPILLVFVLPALCGCHSTQPTPAAPPEHAATAPPGKNQPHDLVTRDNALALLDDLLGDEKKVSLILIIKRESSDLHGLVKQISETAGEGEKLLKQTTPKNALRQLGLPTGEIATREAIAKTKKHLLLSSKDAEFEFQLLLTQQQALSYGRHLAQVASENEPQPARARDFANLASQLKQLEERVLAMLRKH